MTDDRSTTDHSGIFGRPLEGLKVLDLSSVWAMPGAAMYLADQGAEVIKIEPPAGDVGRWILAAPAIKDRSRAFWMVNRNKKGMVLDLKRPEALEILHHLVKSADVIMHNFRPGVAERIGIDYPVLAALNEKLIYVAFTAWGTDGPKRDGRGYDLLLQARSGILARRRASDGQPQPAGLFAVDMASSMLVAYAITLALLQRASTGKGQAIDGSLLQTALSLQKTDLVRLIGHEEAPYDAGLVDIPVFETYECQDGEYIQIVVITEDEWQALALALELDPVQCDKAFSTHASRVENASELREALQTKFRGRGALDWEPILAHHDVPAQRVFTSNDVFEDPQLAANNALVSIDQPGIGELQMLGLPFNMGRADGYAFTPAPELGQHTKEVLRAHGYNDSTIDQLCANGIAVDASA
ncbi:MAG: CoA transferase [Gammaproteobacteria bacterium]|nr:CoA transferase [Gammaproteobacteria bacterium]